MFGSKKGEEEEVIPPLLGKDRLVIKQVNMQSYDFLGARFLWYNKIRSAKKSEFPFFGNKNLEEQMEATRSALQMVERNVKSSLILAYNSTLDAIKNSGSELEGLPVKLEMPDRSNPPQLNEEGDALIISFAPIKFLNIAKVAREKGKGLDFYAEGLAKKFAFKVLGFYCDPANWHTERLAVTLTGLTEEATLAELNAKLAPLKTDLELFAASHQIYKFGGQSRGPKEAGTGNVMDDTSQLSVKELVTDLYFQTLIVNGMPNFLFRYFLTMVSAVDNHKAYRLISNIFQPAIAKAEEIRIRFQASFMMEKEKLRLRKEYQQIYQEAEARPMVEVVKIKGKESRRINYNIKLQEMTNLARAPHLTEKQSQIWQVFLKQHVLEHADKRRGPSVLMEILNMVMRLNQFSVDGKLQVVNALRSYAVEQQKLGQRQVAHMKKALAEAKRKKVRAMVKFKTTKQFDMVKTIEKEIANLESKGTLDIEKFEHALVARHEGLDHKADSLEETAIQDGEKNLGHTAASVYKAAIGLDQEHKLHGALVTHVLEHIQNENDTAYHTFYKHLFSVIPGLYPTEKIVLREALATKIELGEEDMTVSPDEMHSYQEQIDARVTEIGMEAPQIMEQRLVQGAVNTTVDKLLEVGLTNLSLRLVLTLPVNLPNKPAAKLPGPVVRKLLGLNQLKHPFPKHDLILPNVAENEPPAKRINLNRLAKLV